MATSADRETFRPTEAQRQAIEGIHDSMAVDAAAGSGKTAVLIRRILRIVGDDWARLGRVLAITFTEKAAGELRAKLRKHVPTAERYRLDAAWIGTFHSFCARLLRRHGPSINLDPSFDLLDENASGMLMRRCTRDALLALLEQGDEAAAGLVEEIGFAAAAGCLEELMQFRWHADRALTREEASEDWERTALAGLRFTFGKARDRYIERLAELCALDFQELEIRALRLLGSKATARSCRAMFDHILVDEYQDTNDVQTELIQRLFDPAQNRLFIVGDEAQSIYRFRGANVECFARVRKLIEEKRGKSVSLRHNFRSRKSIISFVNASQGTLADGLFADPSSPKRIEAVKPDGRTASVSRLALPAGIANADELRAREAAAIAREIARRTQGGEWSCGDIVLLFRAMSSAGIYEAALRREGIPCSQFGGRGFLERTEITDLIAALRYAANGTDRAALLTILRSPIGGLSDDELTLMAGPDGRGLPSAVGRDAKLALVAELPEMAAHMRPSEIMRRVINEAGLELLWAAIDRSGAANANMDRLVTIARDIERRLPTTLADFNAFISEMRGRGARMKEVAPESGTGDSVRLMTVHAAKGLEFPVVILPDLARRSPPRNKQWIFSRGDAGSSAGVAFKRRDPARPFGRRIATERFQRLSGEESARDEMESKRLLYVAMTRAIDALVIPTHEGIKDAGTWHDWLNTTLETREGAAASELLHPAPSITANVPSNGIDAVEARRTGRPGDDASLRLSVSQLDSYSVCPMQYYLKYVLGLPSVEPARDEPGRIEPNVAGSIVHAMLARSTRDEGRLRAAAESGCLANGVQAGEKNIKVFMKDALKAIDIAGDNIEDGMRELPFEIAAGRATISGTIDWLRPVAGGCEIIDYKTGTREASKVAARAEQYEIQMQAYALAAEAMTGEPVLATRLVFPSAGKSVMRKMDAARRCEAQKNVEEIVSGIEERQFTPPKRPPCEGCVFHRNRMCWEAKKAGVRGKG